MTEEHLDGVERLQHECYPTMKEHEKITAERAAHFLKVFREGQTVAVETSGSGRGRVVGMNSGFLVADFDFAKEGGHTFQEITGGLTYSNHSPDGEFYYGYGESSSKTKTPTSCRTDSLSLSFSFSLFLSQRRHLCFARVQEARRGTQALREQEADRPGTQLERCCCRRDVDGAEGAPGGPGSGLPGGGIRREGLLGGVN